MLIESVRQSAIMRLSVLSMRYDGWPLLVLPNVNEIPINEQVVDVIKLTETLGLP